jgi:hypothetical protein
MVNCADDFEPSSLVVQQMEIYYVVRIEILEPQHTTRNLLIYDVFLVMFCENIINMHNLWC